MTRGRKLALRATVAVFRRFPALRDLCSDAASRLYDEEALARIEATLQNLKWQASSVAHDIGEEPEPDA